MKLLSPSSEGDPNGDDMKFDNVMVPIDGSTLSEIAVDLAVHSAGTFATHLTFVYVIDVRAFDRFGEVNGSFNQMKMRTEGRAALKTASRVASEAGIDHELKLIEGIPWEVLTELSREQDMIIMAVASNASIVGRVGSTTEKVVENCYCPVLTLRSGSHRIKDILLPVTSEHEAAIDVAIETAHRVNGKISVLSIERPGLDSKTIVESVTKRCSEAGVEVDSKVVSGDPVESIVSVSGMYDLIVMGVEKRGGLDKILRGGVTERVVTSASCPVTVVRDV